MPATGEIPELWGNFNFLVELDGIARAGFHECTGMTSTVDSIEHREGGWNTTPHKFPGMTKHTNIILKGGMTTDRTLAEWHQSTVRGEIQRKNGSVVLLDRRQQEVARWDFVRAWPTKYDGPSLNAEGNEIAIESLELVHEGLERVS